MFDVKRPCKDCPFVKDSITNQTLPEHRIKGIVDDILNDGHFFCHKTIDYCDEREHEGKFNPKEGEHLCAGSILYMQREGATTRFLEIMQAMGEYDPADYKGSELLIPPLKKRLLKGGETFKIEMRYKMVREVIKNDKN